MFPGTRLNYTENLLRTGLGLRPDGIAVTACYEGGKEFEELTFKELERRVALYTNTLRKMGVGVGDRIASNILQNSF